MISIVDYGVGNLFSLSNSFAAIGKEVVVTSDPETIKKSEKMSEEPTERYKNVTENNVALRNVTVCVTKNN